MTPNEATVRLREWYQAFKNFGKGNDLTVKEFLEAADLIESMAADLDTLRQFTVELSARNEELRKEKLTLALRVKQLEAERDAAVEDMTKIVQECGEPYCEYCGADFKPNCTGRCWTHNEGFKWRGVQKEE